jgi:hypothetical protein
VNFLVFSSFPLHSMRKSKQIYKKIHSKLSVFVILPFFGHRTLNGIMIFSPPSSHSCFGSILVGSIVTSPSTRKILQWKIKSHQYGITLFDDCCIGRL